jgi:hypothetical protein
MSVRQHVRTFTRTLGEAPWDPVATGEAVLEAHGETLEPLAELVEAIDDLRVGHGAVHMHRRTLADEVGPELPGVPDFEAMVLCMGGLRAQAVAAGAPADPAGWRVATRESPRWMGNLLRMEPDFLDELCLEATAVYVADPETHRAMQAQAAVMREAGRALHTQAATVLGERRTVGGVLRKLVGAGPDLSTGLWVRWTRAVLAAWLLDAKG